MKIEVIFTQMVLHQALLEKGFWVSVMFTHFKYY